MLKNLRKYLTKRRLQRIKKSKNKNVVVEKLVLKAMLWLGSVNSLIVHTLLFLAAYIWYIITKDNTILIFVTAMVSFEAIYLSIFIQMGVNLHSKKLESVADDVEGLQKDVGEIQEDMEEIQEDVEEIHENVQDEDEDEDDEKLLEIQKTINRLIKEVKYIKKQILEDQEDDEDDVDILEIKNTLTELMKEVKEIKKGKVK